jgi:NAD(P)-dependent dehydrogenase (short-subunit alcohol dehydrogenase family)
MKNKLAALLLATTSFISGPLMAATELSGGEVGIKTSGQGAEVAYSVDAKSRPEWMQEGINKAAEGLLKKSDSLWPHNGIARYEVGGINEQMSIVRLMMDLYVREGKKEFWILDVGCANFEWGKAFVDAANQIFGKLNIVVNIVGVTGGRDAKVSPEEINKQEVCKLHVFEGAPIENLSILAETDTRYALFNGRIKFDAMVSRSTFVHLIDPIGTLKSLLGMLSEGGIVITDFPQSLSSRIVPLLQQACVAGGGKSALANQNLLVVWGSSNSLNQIQYLPRGPVLNLGHYETSQENQDPGLLKKYPLLYLSVYRNGGQTSPFWPSQEVRERFDELPKVPQENF